MCVCVCVCVSLLVTVPNVSCVCLSARVISNLSYLKHVIPIKLSLNLMPCCIIKYTARCCRYYGTKTRQG